MSFLKSDTWVNSLEWNLHVLVNEKDDICIHVNISQINKIDMRRF